MRRGILLAIVVVMTAIGLAGAEPRPSNAAPGDQVIVLGDSISAGCCVPANQQLANILAQHLDAQLHNVAVGGASSTSLINQVRTWPSGRTQPQLDEAVSLLGEAPDSAMATIGTAPSMDGASGLKLSDNSYGP